MYHHRNMSCYSQRIIIIRGLCSLFTFLIIYLLLFLISLFIVFFVCRFISYFPCGYSVFILLTRSEIISQRVLGGILLQDILCCYVSTLLACRSETSIKKYSFSNKYVCLLFEHLLLLLFFFFF